MAEEKRPQLSPAEREWLREEVDRRRRAKAGVKDNKMISSGQPRLNASRVYYNASEHNPLDAVYLATKHLRDYVK